MRAAEKYAELEALGEERPKCECHGEPKRWNTGGFWTCVVKHRETRRSWVKNNPEKKREHYRVWRENHIEKARENCRAWKEKNSERVREYDGLRVMIFGEVVRVPDRQFKELAISLREARKAARA